MSMHRNTRPQAPRPKYLITTYWFTKVHPRSLASFRLVVSLRRPPHSSGPGLLGQLCRVVGSWQDHEAAQVSQPRGGGLCCGGLVYI